MLPALARHAALAAEPRCARRTDGVGLAAPQVGVNKRLMVYNAEGIRGRGKEVVLCNPVLVEASEEEDYFEEGCLSFPGIYADVKARASRLARAAPPRPRTVQQQIYANPSVACHTCGERTRILLRAATLVSPPRAPRPAFAAS